MKGKLPEFNSDGLLPPGDYPLSPEELARSFLVAGPSDHDRYPEWDDDWRGKLVFNLSILVEQLWQVGITEIFVDGSFRDCPETRIRTTRWVARMQ